MYSNLSPYVLNVHSQRPIWNAISLQGLPVKRADENSIDALFWTGTQFEPFATIRSVHHEGLTVANNPTSPNTHVDISPGFCFTTIRDSYGVRLNALLTKNLATTWTPGTGDGGRFNAVPLSNITYHVFLIYNPKTEVVDAGFDNSDTGENIPVGWVGRRIASIRRVSGAIEGFTQKQAYFQRKTVAVDLDSVDLSTTGTTYTLSVPTGKPMLVHGNFSPGMASLNSTMSLIVQPPYKANTTPGSSPATLAFVGTTGSWLFYDGAVDYALVSPNTEVWVLTNHLAQVHFRRTGTYADVSQQSTFQTIGWYDLTLLGGS